MRSYYFDTSALVKLYIPETGSQWVDQTVNAKDKDGALVNLVAIAKVGIAEVAAAIARHERSGAITTERQRELYQFFLRDSKNIFETLTITDQSIYLAAALTQRYPLRGYDAVHLASALMLNQRLVRSGSKPLILVSSDNKLCQAASSEGIETENPTGYK